MTSPSHGSVLWWMEIVSTNQRRGRGGVGDIEMDQSSLSTIFAVVSQYLSRSQSHHACTLKIKVIFEEVSLPLHSLNYSV